MSNTSNLIHFILNLKFSLNLLNFYLTILKSPVIRMKNSVFNALWWREGGNQGNIGEFWGISEHFNAKMRVRMNWIELLVLGCSFEATDRKNFEPKRSKRRTIFAPLTSYLKNYWDFPQLQLDYLCFEMKTFRKGCSILKQKRITR